MPWLLSARVRQLVCGVGIGLSMAPVLRGDFLFSDDYYWFDLLHSRPWDGSWEAIEMTMMNGRPLHGLFFIASFPALAVPHGWVALRAVGIALMILTAWGFSRALRRVWDPVTADGVATALVALPAFSLFSFWLIAISGLFASACGAFAAAFALEKSWWHRVLAAALLIAGLSTYQPFALVYFALLALAAMRGAIPYAAYALGIVSTGVYYVLARLCAQWFDLQITGRGNLVFQPVRKARWLAESALPFAAKLWSMATPPNVGLAALVLLAAYGCFRLRHRFRAWWPRLSFIAVAGTTTILPHLSVSETVTRWRTLLPLTVLFALLVFAVLEVRRWPRPLLAGVVVALLGLRAFEVQKYGVKPEQALRLRATQELERIYGAAGLPTAGGTETSVSAARPHPTEVFAWRARETERICGPLLSDDEFSTHSAQHDFSPPGILRVASMLRGLPVPVVSHGEDRSLARAPIVDLRHIPEELCERAR